MKRKSFHIQPKQRVYWELERAAELINLQLVDLLGLAAEGSVRAVIKVHKNTVNENSVFIHPGQSYEDFSERLKERLWLRGASTLTYGKKYSKFSIHQGDSASNGMSNKVVMGYPSGLWGVERSDVDLLQTYGKVSVKGLLSLGVLNDDGSAEVVALTEPLEVEIKDLYILGCDLDVLKSNLEKSVELPNWFDEQPVETDVVKVDINFPERKFDTSRKQLALVIDGIQHVEKNRIGGNKEGLDMTELHKKYFEPLMPEKSTGLSYQSVKKYYDEGKALLNECYD